MNNESLAEGDAVLLNVLGGQLDEILPGQRALLALGPPEHRLHSLTNRS